jgi:hypothetical protein
MSTATLFLDIKKAFDTIWHSGLLYKLSKLELSTSSIKLITSFLSQCKFSVSVEDKMFMPRENPCGGGVEYLHRDPASHKRQRNGTKKGRAIA